MTPPPRFLVAGCEKNFDFKKSKFNKKVVHSFIHYIML